MGGRQESALDDAMAELIEVHAKIGASYDKALKDQPNNVAMHIVLAAKRNSIQQAISIVVGLGRDDAETWTANAETRPSGSAGSTEITK